MGCPVVQWGNGVCVPPMTDPRERKPVPVDPLAPTVELDIDEALLEDCRAAPEQPAKPRTQASDDGQPLPGPATPGD